MGWRIICRFLVILWLVDQTRAENIKEFLTASGRIESYKIVYPKIVPPGGPRTKRSSNSEKLPQRISIEDWTLETSLNEHLIIAPGFVAQQISSSLRIREKRDLADGDPASCELRHGFVVGQPESVTAVTVCSSSWIYGFVQVKNRTYFIEPLTDGRHLLYESKKAFIQNFRGSTTGDDAGNFLQNTTGSFRTEGNLDATDYGLRRLVDYINYLRANNLNTSSANDISPAASGLSEALWTKPESKYQRDEDLYLNLKSRSPKRSRNSSGTGERVKRNLMICNTREFYNLTGDVIDLESKLRAAQEKEESESENFELPFEEDSEHIGYFFDRAWERNKLPRRRPITKAPPPRWLEICIAADYSVVEFHGSRVQQYILALFNIVSAIYKDPSLESNLKLVIVRMIFYAEKKDGMVRRGNARRSLENVNRWNRKFLSSSKESHDIAVWLTRLDLGGPSGYAPVSGVCDPSRSCALNRDEGLTSAFIIAHELAHVLGLTHDGDETVGNSCGDEAAMGSVMAPMVAATFHRFHWSTCSKKEFHQRSKQWICLLNQPNDHNATHLKATVQSTFTMDEQCRMEFGDGYSLCRSFDLPEPCSHLWCGHENSSQICKTKKGPPLEGTECGEDKWCINGFCELVDRRRFGLGPVIHNARDGGWSAWSPWKKCSRSCGVGVQFRSRICSEPTPAYGGADCKGDSEDFKICHLFPCPDRIDLRAQQCSRLANLMGFPALSSRYNSTWLPHEPEEERFKCQLTCRSRQTGEIFFTGENLVDGTPCSYGRTDICVQGKCRNMGCDNVMNSDRVNDDCGECGGQNSNCNNVTGRYQRKLRRGLTRLAVIPQLAYSVRIELAIPHHPVARINDLIITIRDRRRRRNDIGILDGRNKSQIVIVEGAAFRAQKIGDTYTIWSRGPLFSEVVLSLGVPDEIIPLGLILSVSYRYSLHKNDINGTARYRWLLGGWGRCSTSCGGGIRHKTIACKDEVTGKIVPKRKCSLTVKPIQETQKCNLLSCQFKWISGQWEECTSTCGLTGMQHRELYCVHVSVNVTKVSGDTATIIYRDMLPPDRCGPPPRSEQECNRIPCQGRWVFDDWSPCSQSCGRGIQSRFARCGPVESTESSFNCGKFAPFELRSCKIFTQDNSTCKDSCRVDTSEHCSLPVLRRYCQVPGFKRRCCLSCKNA